MYNSRLFIFLFFLVYMMLLCDVSMSHSVTCDHVDYLWNSNNCCEAENPVNCLEYIPKLDLEARFISLEEEINEIKLKLKTLLDDTIASATIDM